MPRYMTEVQRYKFLSIACQRIFKNAPDGLAMHCSKGGILSVSLQQEEKYCNSR